MTGESARIEIGRISVAGAPAAMRDGAGFGAALETALVQALRGMDGTASGTIAVDALKIRLREGAGADEIAAAVAAAVARAAAGAVKEG
ncbi:MAG: hypothetical protein ACK4QW_18620 [Alphaproteobacteria bacterium]